MRARTALRGLAVLVLAGCASAPPAAAAGGPRPVTYDLTLTGTQVTTWSYVTPDPEDPCTTGTQADGDQTIAFRTAAPLRVEAVPPRAASRRRGTGRRATILRLASSRLEAEADRHGQLREVGSAPDSCFPVAEGSDDGCAEDCAPPPPDCGRRSGHIDLQLTFGHLGRDEDEDAEAPLTTPPNRLKLRGTNAGWRGGDLAHLTPRTPLHATYERCDWWVGGPDARAELEGGLLRSIEALGEHRLFLRRPRRLVVHGSAVQCYSQAGPAPCTGRPRLPFGGRTVLAYRLVLERRR